jgi:hypothetical protein
LALTFDAPQWAVTPGQSAVLYDGEICLGGGLITGGASTPTDHEPWGGAVERPTRGEPPIKAEKTAN